MNKVILISIKPEFVEKILNGEKTIELRKCKPNAKKDDILLIYCTNPIKAIVAICRIENVLELDPLSLWKEYSTSLGVTERQFWQYYKNSERAVGISITEVSQLIHQLSLSHIKEIYPKFSPPQTFKYFSEITFLRFFKESMSQVILK